MGSEMAHPCTKESVHAYKTLALRKMKQKDYSGFKTSLGYMVGFGLASETQ